MTQQQRKQQEQEQERMQLRMKRVAASAGKWAAQQQQQQRQTVQQAQKSPQAPAARLQQRQRGAAAAARLPQQQRVPAVAVSLRKLWGSLKRSCARRVSWSAGHTCYANAKPSIRVVRATWALAGHTYLHARVNYVPELALGCLHGWAGMAGLARLSSTAQQAATSQALLLMAPPALSLPAGSAPAARRRWVSGFYRAKAEGINRQVRSHLRLPGLPRACLTPRGR